MKHKILQAKVFHKRFSPKENQFNYNLFYLGISLKNITKLITAIFSLNKFNLFSINEESYTKNKNLTIHQWAQETLNFFNCYKANGDICLITHPKVLGFGFNPVSFFLCFDKEQNLRALITQVNNTFKETHSYFIANKNHEIITENDDLITEKLFHVSPFFERNGKYKFKISYNEKKLKNY